MLVEPVDVQVPEGQGVRLEKLLLVERERGIGSGLGSRWFLERWIGRVG